MEILSHESTRRFCRVLLALALARGFATSSRVVNETSVVPNQECSNSLIEAPLMDGSPVLTAAAVVDSTEHHIVPLVSSNQESTLMTQEERSSPVYTAFDDASWAITSTNLSSHHLGPHQQDIYDEFISECIALDESCREEDEDRIFMNINQPKSVNNYTQEGFKKIRAPAPLYKLLKDFWDKNKDNAITEYNDATAYHNSWQVPTTILLTEDEQFEGGGWNLSAAIWNSARDVLEEWTGQKLSGSSVYGIRIYHNQSVLIPHVDRLPLISSAIINVDQDVDEDWLLEVYGHDGKATNVTMAPGDMVLYESASIIHGRPWPLNGKYYANIFVHFQPMGDLVDDNEMLHAERSNNDDSEAIPHPPFLVEGSPWEDYYYDEFPNGWELLSDLGSLAQRGDLYTLQHLTKHKKKLLAEDFTQCSVLTAAIKFRHLNIVKFLLDETNWDANMLCGEVFHPLDVALDSLDQDEPIVSYLLSKGALTRMEWARKHDRLLFAELYESCDLFQAAIEQKNTAVLEFLTDIREYDVNVVCGEENDQISSTGVTPLDMAFGLFRGQRNEVSKVLFQSDAFSFSDLVHLVIRNSEDDYLGDDEDSEDGDE